MRRSKNRRSKLYKAAVSTKRQTIEERSCPARTGVPAHAKWSGCEFGGAPRHPAGRVKGQPRRPRGSSGGSPASRHPAATDRRRQGAAHGRARETPPSRVDGASPLTVIKAPSQRLVPRPMLHRRGVRRRAGAAREGHPHRQRSRGAPPAAVANASAVQVDRALLRAPPVPAATDHRIHCANPPPTPCSPSSQASHHALPRQMPPRTFPV